MRRRQFIVLAGLGAAVPLAGCGGTQDTDGVNTVVPDTNTAVDETNTPSATRDNTTDPNSETVPPTTVTDSTGTVVPDSETATETQLTVQTQYQETSHRTLKHERSETDYSTGWTFPPSTGSHSVISPGLRGTEYALRFDGFQKGYLDGATAADRGLQQGRRFAFSFTPTNYSGAPSLFRFQFACNDENDGDMYRIEFEGSNTSGSDWSLEKYTNATPSKVDAAGDGVGVALGEEYRVEVDWNAGDTHITARWYNPDGTLRSTPLSITDTEYSQPGVYLMCNSNVTVVWDGFRSLPS